MLPYPIYDIVGEKEKYIDNWYRNLTEVFEYKRKFNRMPGEDNYKLENWLKQQRISYKNGSMPQVLVNILDGTIDNWLEVEDLTR